MISEPGHVSLLADPAYSALIAEAVRLDGFLAGTASDGTGIDVVPVGIQYFEEELGLDANTCEVTGFARETPAALKLRNITPALGNSGWC